MTPASHATHAATGQYYVTSDGYHDSWIIVAPDGTKHDTYTYIGRGTPDSIVAKLNAEDRSNRAMTPAEQQLAAIRTALAEYTRNRIQRAEVGQTESDRVRDAFAVIGTVTDLAAEQPAPEPLTDTLPPGPIACPSCGDVSWRECCETLTFQPVEPTPNGYDYDGEQEPDESSSRHQWYECASCMATATPGIEAALTARITQ